MDIHQLVLDDLPLLVTGDLSGDDQARALEHVASCEPCQRELTELEQVSSLLGAVGRMKPPPRASRDAAPGVWVRPRTPTKRPVGHRLLWAASVLLAFAAGFFVPRGDRALEAKTVPLAKEALEAPRSARVAYSGEGAGFSRGLLTLSALFAERQDATPRTPR